ncbi:MAG: transcriptional repressor [Alphaproteobacteria bacterium]|nr:transcriptional repressor [Alphaproteobacteria bacterium]
MMSDVFKNIDADEVRSRLKSADLRPTKQRMQLAALLWSKGCRHVTAEGLHRESIDADIKVSLATIYNTLHQFTSHSLLREVVVDRGCSYFDTNITPHHHFLYTDTGELEDIPHNMVEVNNLPQPPKGMEVSTVDVIIRVSKVDTAHNSYN